VLQSNYGLIKNVFRHYAGAFGAGEPFTLGQNGFNEFLTRCNILDPEGKGCDRVEADTLFIGINLTGPKVGGR
jgi:hypothetical protein